MRNNTIIPIAPSSDSSYVISVQGLVQTPIYEELSTRKTVADFFRTSAADMRRARQDMSPIINKMQSYINRKHEQK